MSAVSDALGRLEVVLAAIGAAGDDEAPLDAARQAIHDWVCAHTGHIIEDDQCGKPEHRYCVQCTRRVGDIEARENPPAPTLRLGAVARDGDGVPWVVIAAGADEILWLNLPWTWEKVYPYSHPADGTLPDGWTLLYPGPEEGQ